MYGNVIQKKNDKKKNDQNVQQKLRASEFRKHLYWI